MISLTTMLVLGGVPLIGLVLWRRREELEERRRAVEEQLGRALREAAATVPGGSAERALVVATPAVIEARAGAMRCLACESLLDLREHAVAPRSGGQLRVVHLVCRSCRSPRTVWFRIQVPPGQRS